MWSTTCGLGGGGGEGEVGAEIIVGGFSEKWGMGREYGVA